MLFITINLNLTMNVEYRDIYENAEENPILMCFFSEKKQ